MSHASPVPKSNTVLFLEGAAASSIATVASNPFEVIKTRLQLQGELMKMGTYKPEYNGMMSGIVKIIKEEGVLAIQKGLTASIAHQVILNGVRLGAYCRIKQRTEEICGGPSLMVTLTSAGASGVLGAVASNPLMLVKTRLQSKYSSTILSSEAAVLHGTQHNYGGVVDGLGQIYTQNGGVRGLFHGLKPAVIRTTMGSIVQLTTYDTLKEYSSLHLFHVPDTNIKVHIFASALTSFAVVAAMNPFDLIMTRVYNNKSVESKSTGMIASLSNVVATEGFSGLYKGSLALWWRLTPHFIFTFVALEQIRNYTR